MLEADVARQTDAAEPSVSIEVASLHDHCGVYTQSLAVIGILDDIGWTASTDLSRQRLLEPAAGDGVFVIEAARRLLISLRRRIKTIRPEFLVQRIQAFELHPVEGRRAREGLIALLLEFGLNMNEARSIAERWLVIGDFLLHDIQPGSFTHAAGNPPYVRWSKIPTRLRHSYEKKLPRSIAKGDIFLPFLDRSIEALQPGGRLGFLCSDRWQFMAFARDFRAARLLSTRIVKNVAVSAKEAYQRSVEIYPSVLVLEKLEESEYPGSSPVPETGTSLEELGFDVRVGPALGCTAAYVLDSEDFGEVEQELLAPWVRAGDVLDGALAVSNRKVICLHDADGKLRNLAHFPKTDAWLRNFKGRLEQRSVVARQGAVWYRPIDRVFAAAWAAPKILVPELSKIPRATWDDSGVIPSHGIYAITARTPEADLEALYRKLSGGGLRRLLEGKVPKVKGEYWRCYKSILNAVRL